MNRIDWKRAPETSPESWLCNIVWGGNRLALENFTMPGLEGRLLSVPCAAREAGGDIYHVTVCDHGVFSKFLLIDVAGHDQAAADISTRLQKPLARLMNELDNAAILEALNANILANDGNGSFATAAAATYNHWDHSWTYAYAGHPYMLMKAGDGRWYQLPECNAGPPAGVLGDTRYFQNEIQLSGNEWLMIFSDALLEIQQADGHRVGFSGLIKLLENIEATDIDAFYQALVDGLLQLNGGEVFEDDLTLILLKHKPHSKQLLHRLYDGGHTLMMRWMKRHEKHCHVPLDPTRQIIQ